MKDEKCGRYVTLLSLDGGGIRGLISAMVLQKLEELICAWTNKQNIGQFFDLIVATSTGGILAAGLAKPCTPLAAKDLVKLYTERGREIFEPSRYRRQDQWWRRILYGANYDAEPLEKILKEKLGNTQLKQTYRVWV